MAEQPPRVAETAAPTDRPRERLDVRDLPPPEPLTETLQRLAAMDDDGVLLQVNDRVPRHLFPKLDERGWTHDTVEGEDGVVTAVWRE